MAVNDEKTEIVVTCHRKFVPENVHCKRLKKGRDGRKKPRKRAKEKGVKSRPSL